VGSALVVAVDVQDGKVAVEGWTRASTLTAPELARRCADVGVTRLLVTATARDGSLAGPDLDLLAQVIPIGLPVIAAGGVASTADLRALQELGCEAAVAGSALLAGRFTSRRRAPHSPPADRDPISGGAAERPAGSGPRSRL
jgi:phosphoribosylformimino-5-aminoimidazole carboxamide ribotide isomerase